MLIEFRACVDYSLKFFIFNELCKRLMEHNLKVTFDKYLYVDMDRLIDLLSTLNQESRYFTRDFIQRRVEMKQSEGEPNEHNKYIYDII